MKFRRKFGESIEMNMTPMIDCIFQLIIFFMLVTDLSQKELEVVTLPPASHAVEDENPEKRRITINVCRWPPDTDRWEIKVHGRVVDYEQLRQILRDHYFGSERTSEGYAERTIMIRSDENARFELVQNVLRICAEEKFYKIEFGAKVEKPSKP